MKIIFILFLFLFLSIVWISLLSYLADHISSKVAGYFIVVFGISGIILLSLFFLKLTYQSDMEEQNNKVCYYDSCSFLVDDIYGIGGMCWDVNNSDCVTKMKVWDACQRNKQEGEC